MDTRQNKGITLIALIITIIVLLLLAGIVIAALAGDNGIITQARNARNKHNQGQADEEQKLGDISKIISDIEEETDNSNMIPIYNQTQLQKIGSEENLNINSKTYKMAKNARYVLENDITILGKFTPIQNFYGTLDGKNFKILELDLNSTTEISRIKGLKDGIEIATLGHNSYAGLIINNYGTIKNIGFENTDIYIDDEDAYDGYTMVAIIAVKNEGIIDNCYITGNIYGPEVASIAYKNYGVIQNSYNASSVVDYFGTMVGGLVNYNAGVIQKCFNSGLIDGGGYAAGLVGYNCGRVNDCFNIGNITASFDIGGIISDNDGDDGEIINCYNIGTLISNYSDQVGGIKCVPWRKYAKLLLV